MRVDAPMRRWLAVPVALSAIILAGAVVSTSSVRDVLTGVAPQSMSLEFPPAYVLTSPLSRFLDIIGLMSVQQHIAFVITIVGFAALLAALRKKRTLLWAGITLVALVIAYGLSAAFPRPMAMLAVLDREFVRVDFHSHTNASGDARKSFDAEDNRAWHRAGGFDVAYVSDHRSFAGAEAAVRNNPRIARDGTVLLSAYEGRYRGLFMIDLGLTRADSMTLLDSHRWLRAGNLTSGLRPANVAALPGPLSDVQREARDGAAGIAAIEIIDGSPKAFSQRDADRKEIIARADSLNIALVASSNNHGWGRVVPGWTLVNIPGWQSMSPDSLGAQIERELRINPRAVRVIERARPSPKTFIGAALTVPAFAAQTFTGLSLAERFVWILWMWVVAFTIRFRRGRIPSAPQHVLSS
ncbi:MAG TPA: hypothetical protein VM099_13865 [Gemmatimonadaceae bacterium]|nr:hypothetical protein [Gemmatimonadaceae bacterium]